MSRSTEFSYVIESSVCECGSNSGRSLFYNYKGMVSFASTNISRNSLISHVALEVSSPNFQNMSYCTIESNNASSYIMFYLDGVNEYIFEKCNILKNFQESNDYGNMYIYGQLILDVCSILEDRGKGQTFYLKDASTVTVKNSFYDSLTYNIRITTSENNTKTSKYIDLNYFYAYLCDFYPTFFNRINLNKNNKCSLRACYNGNWLNRRDFAVVMIVRKI